MTDVNTADANNELDQIEDQRFVEDYSFERYVREQCAKVDLSRYKEAFDFIGKNNKGDYYPSNILKLAFRDLFPSATFKFELNKPHEYSNTFAVTCYVTVTSTVNGFTYSMTGVETRPVYARGGFQKGQENPDSVMIHNAQERCLARCLALVFNFGADVYTENLDNELTDEEKLMIISDEQVEEVKEWLSANNKEEKPMLKWINERFKTNTESIEQMTQAQFKEVVKDKK